MQQLGILAGDCVLARRSLIKKCLLPGDERGGNRLPLASSDGLPSSPAQVDA